LSQRINVFKTGSILVQGYNFSAMKNKSGHMECEEVLKSRNNKMIRALQGPYLKPYSDITTAGSPFPVATMS
jgi:uncharacterized protein YabN with tetrapyrrole methylase and pyrophosphatase domain